MAYKKYHYRKGKRYGPYYYESYRDKTGKVKKRYIGITDSNKESKDFLPTKNSRKSTTNFNKNLFFIFLFLFLIVFAGFSFIKFNGEGESFITNPLDSPISKFSGFVISEISDEGIIEEFDRDVNLEIKEPAEFGGETIGENKNKRMDFDL